MQTSTTKKPFYKKLWFILLAALIVLSTIGQMITKPAFDKMDKERAEKQKQDSIKKHIADSISVVRGQAEEERQVEANKKEMKETMQKFLDEPFDNSEFQGSPQQIESEIDKLFNISSDISLGESVDDSLLKALAAKAKTKLIALQQKEFPIMRMRYAKALAEKMWEKDIYITCSGSTIRFTGGMFASNANIQEWNQTMSDKLNKFRYQRAEYRWYKGADEFTYYTLKSPKDSEEL